MSTAEPQVVFFLTVLNSAELRDEYEAWVREIDTPLALGLDGVSSYRVVRLESPVMEGGEVPVYNYIEIIEVSDLDAYRNAIASAPASFFAQFATYIGAGYHSVAGTVIN